MAQAASGPVVPIVLDKQQFTQTLKVPALRVPNNKCQALVKSLRGFTLNLPKVRCIVHDGDSKDTRLLLMEESFQQEMPANLKELVSEQTLDTVEYDLTLEYANFSADQIIKKLLPAGVEGQTSFETIGHIAHLNLRDECLPYKHLIGQVILDKSPHLKTVINKVGQIENEYRVFQMEVIAGEASFVTEMVQCGVKFRLDFSKVYWNSRLETEHKRLVASFKPSDVILDVMAGVGPFAVPAGKLGCPVYANDLNPDSVHWLRENIRLNKVAKCVHAYNMDGRKFIRQLLRDVSQEADSNVNVAANGSIPVEASKTCDRADRPVADVAPNPDSKGVKAAGPTASPSGPVLPTHVIMNLPASAVEFLDAFRGAFPGSWRDRQLPTVHCYTFKKAGESEEDVVSRVEHYLGAKLESAPQIHVVRTVAPGKLMLCVSFTVPTAVAFMGDEHFQNDGIANKGDAARSSIQSEDNDLGAEGGVVKRQKLDEDTTPDL